ncbi:MAG: dihydroorotase [Candidatus Eisenbacteria bacterium]|nr:dihydroorotase [Candidatus Eisenbacteria bacterium]
MSEDGKLLLRSGRVIDPSSGLDARMDVLISGDKIELLAERIEVNAGMRVLELEGKLVVPGLVDMHVHLREPGREDEETIGSGGAAAARGGFTSIACMANTQPPIDTSGMVRYVLETAARTSPVKVFSVAAATVGLGGERMAEIMDLRDAGAVAVSDDGNFVGNSEVARRVMEYTRMAGLPFISHCEDPYLGKGGVMNEGYWSTTLGLKGIPAASEAAAVAREIVLAELTLARVHIAHVSTRAAVDLIRQAKKRGLSVTAEATPHHLVLSDKAVSGYDTSTKMNPPLRSEEDREAVVEGLRDGTIDVIASDHAPHCEEEKDVEFDEAAFGVIGLETTVGVVMTFLVSKGLLSLSQAIAALTLAPASVLGIKAGKMASGLTADITVIDPQLEWTVDPRSFASRSRNTPFKGWTLVGKAIVTVVDGKIVRQA